uniref:Toxin-antitoxin system, antitoxin component n=1 Tax=uncultured bacterium contig00063 TaxID=1181546 RepID=A0A806KH52_9BACT|nr:hypothetical protein [uncultured bacterium contig00063]
MASKHDFMKSRKGTIIGLVREPTGFPNKSNILEYIGKIWKYTEETKDAEELFELNDQMNLNASLTLLSNIGENVSKITEKLKEEYSNIEWQQIKYFRNKIVHECVGIDLAIVYEIITNDLKTLKHDIEKIK